MTHSPLTKRLEEIKERLNQKHVRVIERFDKLTGNSDYSLPDYESDTQFLLECVRQMREALETLGKQFENLNAVQDKALKNGFEKACENWDAVTEHSFIDFNIVYETLAALEKLAGK